MQSAEIEDSRNQTRIVKTGDRGRFAFPIYVKDFFAGGSPETSVGKLPCLRSPTEEEL